jgi:hypothetical protein
MIPDIMIGNIALIVGKMSAMIVGIVVPGGIGIEEYILFIGS